MASAEFGLQTLAARTTRDIVASRQVLTKAGFVPVGPAAHVTAVGALWLDGSFWFQTGSHTRKNRHVARDPRCSIAVSIRDADVVAEGEAALETDLAALTRLAKAWADQGWPAEVDETGPGVTAPFNAPVAGIAAVERLSHQATFGHRGAGNRAGRADSLQVLTPAQRGGRCGRLRSSRHLHETRPIGAYVG